MIELVIGFIVGVVVALRQGWAGDAAVLAGGLVGVGAYLASCAWRPYSKRCPWPWCTKPDPLDEDSRGNYRLRRVCRVCGNGRYMRVGARLIGRG